MTEEQNPETSKNPKTSKNPNYFMIGLREILGNVAGFIFLPFLLIIVLIKWKGGDPKVIKSFEKIEKPPSAIFLTMIIWIICFILIYGICSICF